jgi:hypothetical protein
MGDYISLDIKITLINIMAKGLWTLSKITMRKYKARDGI